MKKIYELMKRLKKEKCIIYGTGVAGKSAAESFMHFGIIIQGFVTGDKLYTSDKFMGFPMIKENEISTDALVIICANPEYEIHKRLMDNGHANFLYLDPQILRNRFWDENYDYNVKELLSSNREKIEKVRNLLADPKSLLVFDTLLSHREDYDFEGVQFVKEDNQYFNNSLIGHFSGTYVDCGAFTGDTLLRYMGQLLPDEEYTYYAFEADASNFEKLNKLCDDHGWVNVVRYNNAVWSSRAYLGFEVDTKDAKVSGRIVESKSKTSIQGISLDEALYEKKIDMIGMDIEGAEMKALKGAKKIIQEQTPILSISVYHNLSDFWEIPLLIGMYNSDYKIYFRHHRWTCDDTVCYAIPAKIENK